MNPGPCPACHLGRGSYFFGATTRSPPNRWQNASASSDIATAQGNVRGATDRVFANLRSVLLFSRPGPYLHYALDNWFEDVVRPRMRGKATLVRFADDFVMTFETSYDAKLVMDVLGKRLGRFGLKLHPDKTRFIDFRPQHHGGTPPDCKAQSFDFLGFTHS